MDITKEKIEELKGKIKIDKPLDELLEDSLVVGDVRERELLGESQDDCQTFEFDIKLLKISGSICKSGKLDFRGSVFGVEIAHTTTDIAKKEVCYNPKLGKIVGVKYCFSLKKNCFWTRGEIDGWFEKRTGWNTKILCF
jgi:hypothetical protein